MGYSTTVATAFTAIMLIAGITILIFTTTSSFNTITQAMESQTARQEIMIKEQTRINSVKKDNVHQIRFNVTNTGETGIKTRDFPKCDIIITYTTQGTEKSHWIEYDHGGTANNHWRINRVFFHGQQGDRINPIDLVNMNYGIWDPNETLEILVYINDPAQEFLYITFITPNGVKSHHSFCLDYQIGTAILQQKTTEVWVRHYLGRTPVNIQTTPNREPNFYWVNYKNSTHFQISMKPTKTYDITFYWRIE